MRHLLSVVISGLLIGVRACFPTEKAALSIQTYAASEAAAMANSHLIIGEKEALLVDVVMTRSEATKLAGMVERSGRTLKMIFITHAHPDHYLGLEVLRENFPQTRIVAVAPVAAAIEKNGPNMVARLRARLGDEGPTKLIVPEPLTATELYLEGTKIDRSVIAAMRAYLTDFTQAVKLANAAEAMQMMLKKYPDYEMSEFLEGSIQAHFPATEKN